MLGSMAPLLLTAGVSHTPPLHTRMNGWAESLEIPFRLWPLGQAGARVD